MKYLSHYLEQAQTDCFRKHGAFFCFSNESFAKNKDPDIGDAYVNVGAGLLCPEINAKQLIKELQEATESAIAQDIAENGKVAIIHRELANHECEYVGCYQEALPALEGYGFDEREIREIFLKGELILS